MLQNLQLEIDSERENFLTLTATGRKILNHMEGNEEDSVIIQQKLEEINHRWNHLKAKSITIRYVLKKESEKGILLYGGQELVYLMI